MKLLNPFDIDLAGVNLVEASAGTGKTYNITSLYIRALIERDIPVGNILVVTYTEAATKELKDRLLTRIRESIAVLKTGEAGDEDDEFLRNLLEHVEDDDRSQAVNRLEEAVRTFDESAVHTIHGFCYRALQEQAFESGVMYDAEMIGDDSELVQEAVDDYWRRWVDEVSENPQKQPLIELLSDRGLGPESLARELGSYIGKPYLKILPEDVDEEDVDNRLEKFHKLHAEMKSIWEDQRSAILSLLSRDEMSNYRSDWLTSWFQKMDKIFQTETAVIDIFDQFDRFTQSRIDNSLKKAAEKKGISPPQHPFFKKADEYQRIAESLKNYAVAFKKNLLQYLRNELNQKKEELQVLSYDDLLLRLRNALLNDERGQQLANSLREKYPIALVDEFQDTDPNQYDIFSRIYEDSSAALFMIGDPKQSIYSFRGADVYSYIRARKAAPEDHRFRLDRNFRSTPDLLRGLNAFWSRHDNPFVVDEIEYKEVTWGWPEERYDNLREYGQEPPPIRFRRLSKPGQDELNKEEARKKAARDTAREIQRLLEGGKSGEITLGDGAVKAKDIAVLVRKHKQADLITEALRERGIKSVQHSEKSVLESEEAAQLEQLLKAVAEPADETLIKTALSLPLTGFTAGDLYAIEEDDERWTPVLRQFSDWHKMWQEQDFAAMFRALTNELKVAEHLITYPDGERRLTNLLHLGELLQEESQQRGEGTRGLLHWLARKRQDDDKNRRDEEQMRLESDEELVKIVTMHKSKGLQYPIVFCPFLWHGPHIQDSGQPLAYHLPDSGETAYLDFSGKTDPERPQKRFYAEREELAESLRLAYVAMTRAQHCLYLTWEWAGSSELSSLGYLLQNSGEAEAQLRSKVGLDDSEDVDPDEMHHAIEDLCREYPELFTLEDEPEEPKSEQAEILKTNGESPDFRLPSFERFTPLQPSYRVSSFSSLISWMDEDDPDMPDYDQFLNAEIEAPEQEATGERNIFTFPKGPQPGTCLHNIFENYYSKSGNKDEVITNQLRINGIDESWKNTVSDMLETVLNKPLHQDKKGLRLSAVKDDQIPEMEFYFRNEEVEAKQLLEIIRENERRDFETRGKAESGFLKGYIDLTFKFEDKYYLLDYKSNYLGDASSDYRQEHLEEEMREASYDLQYHIYTIALHRFLKERLDSYSYDKHFGGAFYLFVRGINEDGREGIYFDRPDYSTIRNLNEYMLEGRNNE